MTTQDPHYLPPAPIGSPDGSFAWVEWYRKLREVAESGQTAYIQLTTVTDPALADKLNKNAADTLGATITFNTQGAFQVGNATWNGSTATGTGVMFTQNGIVGVYNNTPKFVLKVDGTATFGGELSAATGTFSGSLSAASGTFTGSLSGATGTFSGIVQAGSFVTATSGQRITINESNNNKILAYDSSNNLIAEFGGTSASGGYFPIGNLSKGPAVYGKSQSTVPALYGTNSANGQGVAGAAQSGNGVEASSVSGYSLYCYGGNGAYISGNLTVTGTITGTVSYATSSGVADHAYRVIPSSGNGIVYSAGQTYSAQIQTDGNFVVYGVSTWASGTNVSDVRKKENIQLTSKNGLDTINALEVKDFSWKRDKLSSPNITGFIAQEVQQVIPNAVSAVDTSGNPNEEFQELLFLHKEEIIPYLVKAVQELSQELKLLKDTVNGNVR